MSAPQHFRELSATTPGKLSGSRRPRGEPVRADCSRPGCTARGAWRPMTAAPKRLTAADVMTAREVAGLLHAPVSTIEDWARRGILPSVKIGRRRLYIRQNIEAVLAGEHYTDGGR
jgi:excisionase family DNA binding protein